MAWLLIKTFLSNHLGKIAVAFLLLSGVGVGLAVGIYHRDLKARAEAAEAAAALANKALAGMANEIADNQKALAAREGEIKNLAHDRAALAEKLREIREADPKARAWADTCLPDSVECLLK